MTDGCERGSVLVGDLKVRAGEQGTVGKELHRLEWRDGGRRMRLLRIGKRERRHSVRLLATDAERFPAARENRQMWALTHECVDQVCAAVEQVLAVIEQEQEPLVLEVLGEHLADRLARLFLQSQHRRHRLRYQTRV